MCDKNTNDEKTWTVYMHTNKINNKVYVGITSTNVGYRWLSNGTGYLRRDKCGFYHQPKFAHAINKYGWNNFEHIIFAENLGKESACHMERLLIALWDSFHNGYNCTMGGDGTLGYKHTEEAKQKMKENHKYYSGENNHWFGRKHKEESKQKISKSHKGVIFSDEHKKHLSESRKNVNISGGNNPRAKKVIRLDDYKVYDCIKYVASDNDMCITTVKKRCDAHKGFMCYDEWLKLQEIEENIK